MKLHLPTKLRAAVIAAMAFFALAPAAQAEYDTTAATYTKVLQGKSTIATAGGQTSVEFASPVSALRSKEWTMIVSATGLNKYSSVFLQQGSGVFAGGADQSPDWLDARMTNGFGFMVSNNTLLVATSTTGNYSGNISAYAYKLTPSKVGAISSVDLVLGYTPTGWDEVNMAYTSGDLSIMSGSVTLSNGQVVQISQTPVFTDIALAGSSAPMEIRSTSALPANASTTVTIILPGDESNWTIAGLTSLENMKSGSFYADTTGEGNHTALDTADKVYFIGGDGVLFADEDATFSNEIATSFTMENPTAEAVIGLGAAAGKTLTMEHGDAVVATAEANGGLKVTGAGTVKMDCATGSTLSKLTIDSGSTLELNGGDHDITLTPGNTSSTSNLTATDSTVRLYVIDGQTVEIGKLTGNGNTSSLSVDGNGTLKATDITADGDVIVQSPATLKANSVTTDINAAGHGISLISDNATMEVTGAVEAHSIQTADATLKAGSVTAKRLVEGSSAIIMEGKGANAFTAQQLTATKDGVAVAGVQDAVITLTDDTFSSTGATSDTTFTKGASSVETSSTAGKLDMTTDGLTVAGAVTAGTVTLEDYDLTVGSTLNVTSLEASGDSVINVRTTLDADTLSLSDDVKATADTVDADTLTIKDSAAATAKTLKTDSATIGGTTTLTTAELKDAVVTATTAGFTSMEATAATIGDGYTLKGTGMNPATLSVGTLTAQGGSALSHVAVSSSTTITSSGTQTLNDVVFVNGYDKYTSDGTTPIFTVGSTTGLTDVHLTGSVSSASGVSLDKIVVNGDTIEFTDNAEHPTIVTLISSAAGVTVPTDYELNITPCVEAVITKDGDNLVLQGFNNREVLVNQLSDMPDRASAINSMLQVYDNGAMAGELNEVFKYLGRQYMYGTTPEALEAGLNARRTALAAAAGSSLANLTDAQRRGIEDVQKNLRNRIVQMGGQEEGILHGWDKGNVQAWVQGDGAFHTLSDSSTTAGYDYDVYGATVGANVDLNAHWTVGAALSAEYGSMSGKGSDKLDADTETTYLNLFGRYQKGHWTHIGIFTIGMDDTDTTRRVLDYKAEGSTSGTSFSGYYELGYLMPLDEEVRQLIQPIFNVSLTSAKTDSFTETGSIGTAGLKYDSQNLFYGSVGVGARYQAVLSRSVYERNTMLELRGQVNQHFGDSTDEATVSFIGGGSPYTVHGAKSGDFGVQLGAGLSIPVYNQTTLFGDVDGEFRSKQTDFRANIGVRYEF